MKYNSRDLSTSLRNSVNLDSDSRISPRALQAIKHREIDAEK